MNGDMYHVCNRGVGKSKVFNNSSDYYRFVQGLYKFNNQEGALRTEKDVLTTFPPQERLVEILKWTLLPNHYHLLLYENVEGGVTEFIKRVGNGYTKYFNIKNERSGYLFQNKAKCIRIENDPQFLYIPFYIDLNAAELVTDNSTDNPRRALERLQGYQWSSLRDYYHPSQFEPVINTELFYELYETDKERYQKELYEWLSEHKEDNFISDI